MALISFLSDFGTADEFVGVVHAVIARLTPSARVVDVTHQIPVHDVACGAATLARSLPWLVPGVVLAVVDPGVGTSRRAVAIEAPGAILVGPDNGLLVPAVARLGGAVAAVELKERSPTPQLQGDVDRHGGLRQAGRSPGSGVTFDGRDVFAPAAARASTGIPIEALGDPVDPASLVSLSLPTPDFEGSGAIRGVVSWIDSFGNAALNIDLEALCFARSCRVTIRMPAGPLELGSLDVVGSYEEIGNDRVALVVDSYGMLSVCAYKSSAARTLGVTPGVDVWLHPKVT